MSIGQIILDAPGQIASAQITLELAYRLYDQLNGQHFGGQLPVCTIELSSRLIRTAGKIWPKQRRLRLSLAYHQRYGLEELANTILHEMVHLWLHEQGLASGHTPLFRQKMAELGLSNRIHALPMPPSPYKYVYVCPTCLRETNTRRQIRSSCGCCDKKYNPQHRLRLVKKLNL